MHERLTDLFRRREIDKRYWAMVKGVPEPRQGIVNIPLAELQFRGNWEDIRYECHSATHYIYTMFHLLVKST